MVRVLVGVNDLLVADYSGTAYRFYFVANPSTLKCIETLDKRNVELLQLEAACFIHPLE